MNNLPVLWTRLNNPKRRAEVADCSERDWMRVQESTDLWGRVPVACL
jgi:hypothetical protein